MDVNKVKEFWDSQATNAQLAVEAVTHRDHQQRLLEIHIVEGFLRAGDRLLDVGCGNGYATAIFSKRVAEIKAVDYSAAMIERAKKEHAGLKNVRWDVQDALTLNLPKNSFDVAITLRCIINLGSWTAQQTAIRNIHQALRPGGLLLMGEGTVQGRAALNHARTACDLTVMPPVTYNLDLDEDVLWPFVSTHFDILEVRRLGLYDFISRVIHPLLVWPQEPHYDAKLNEVGRLVAERLGGFDALGREFIAVLRKK